MVKYIVKRDLKEFFPKEFSNRELIGQFLDYVMNHFFQTSSEKEINGYIGKKTVAMEYGDYYIEEPTNDRQNYQLTPAVVSFDENNNVNNIVDYCNFINTLKLQGVDVNDISRIIDGKYWSWCPLINVDMFINYNYYYWIEEGPEYIELLNQTDVKNDILGKKSYIYHDNNDDIEFQSGMRIKITNDYNNEYNGNIYIVEGVEKSIQLINDNNAKDIKTIPDYFVMERGCIDGNKWSKRNRWFHRSIVAKGNSTLNFVQAKKPIICFNKDIVLYNYGTYYRGDVNFIYNGKKSDIHGKPFTTLFQGTRELNDGDKILIIGDDNIENNNKIYEVSGKSTIKTIILQPLYNGLSSNGSATNGEGVNVLEGTYAEKYFYFNGYDWVEGQQKVDVNQSPLFNLYDVDGYSLDNKLIYNQSNFKGNKLFDYKLTTDNNTIVDTDLGKKILTNGYGNYIFDNVLHTEKYTYLNYNNEETIKGYKFVKINGSDKLVNDWHLSSDSNNHYISTEIKLSAIKYDKETDSNGFVQEYVSIKLNYQPNESSYRKSSFVYVNGNLLNDGIDYIIDNKVLKIFKNVELKIDDYIYVKLLVNKLTDKIADGYFYNLPLSLTSNPLNKEVEEINYNECFDQMTSIISNQVGFSGNSGGNNNYLNTAQDLSVGTEIIQHSHQILKTMLLNNNDDTNIRNSISFVSAEYNKFKTKFKNVIEAMSKTNEYTETSDIYDVISKALSKINVSKVGLYPFYNNGVAYQLGECYIPATPAYLRLDNCYKPRITTVEGKEDGNLVLLCHDGSYQMLFNDYRDEALLELENQIYESIKQKERPIYNIYKVIPGKFRKTDYSYDEYKSIIAPFFEQWCAENNYDYTLNNTYSSQNPFTWNYSSVVDKDGEKIYGSYKSLYLYYYDTYRPHTHPWEMLGFGDKPEWWEAHYGEAPYTSSNMPMWIDIENGYIADGENKGYHEEFKRPNLIKNYLPVDEKGELKTPYQIGIIEKNPIAYYASKNWESGDMGLIETMWLYTSDYRYSLQTAMYLMKPIEWIEENFETIGKRYIFQNTEYEQLIFNDTLDRTSNSKTYIHNEYVDNEYIRKIGIQQWVSDYLIKQNLNITDNLGNPYRSLDIRLFYRCGSFYKKDTLKVYSDNYGNIPESNYKLDIYKSNTPYIFAYSAIIIVKTDRGYMIDGYNKVEPYFLVYEPERSATKTNVEINGRNVVYYNVWKNNIKKIKYKTTFTSIQDLYEIICGYGQYLNNELGIEFTEINSNGMLIDYTLKSEDFLRWVSTNPDVNQMIILNPASSEIRINHNSMLDIVGKRLNGGWTVVGTSGKPIYNDDLRVYRHQGYTDIKTNNQIMTMLRLNCIDYEHCILFDNKTIYGDILYDSLLCIKTQRFKINAVAANNWDGTLFAPGYLIQKDGCISNFDKLADDFNYMYDTDDIRTKGKYREIAQQTIGYQKSSIFENLLLSDRNMFDFYKGLLKEKGTKKSFNKLNRSKYIMSSNDSKIELYDNWAFKVADFGYTNNSSVIELNIDADKITQNPQIISFTLDNINNTNESIINIDWNDKNWYKKIYNKDSNRFYYGVKDVNQTGGFVQLNDVNYIVSDLDTFESTKNNMKVGETIWVVKVNSYDWNVYKKIDDEQYISLRVDNISKLKTFNKSYLQKGDLVYVSKDILNNYEEELIDPMNLIKDNQYIFDSFAWSVFKYNGKDFELYRVENKNIDIHKLYKCFIIDDKTDATLSEIQLYDPLQNIIPNNVLDEINYITSYDPVLNYNDTYKWGDDKIGYLWWDTSKVRYLDYHQGDINYRRDNWGKQLPGSEIAIMEWTRSTKIPTDVNQYVHKQVWNDKTSSYVDYYYYWVKNPSDIPSVNFRKKSAFNISSIINNPTLEGIIWLAPISCNTFIICNYNNVTTGSDFVIQMNFKDDKDLNNHTEWTIVREGDDNEIPETLWQKMKDSLLGKDELGQIVPDPDLSDKEKLGLLLRPRQTMFKDIIMARKNFVDICNIIFADRDVSSNIDVGTDDFNNVFLNNEELPDYDYIFETYYEMISNNDVQMIGKNILVKSDETHDGIWTFWNMKNIGQFELLSYQKYDIQKFWNYVDLYNDDNTYLIQPDYTFNNEESMNSFLIENNIVVDSYIKCYNSYGKWILYQYIGKNSNIPILKTIGLEDGSLELNDLIYSYMESNELINDDTIFIDNITKYQYLDNEVNIVLNKIFSYFEQK